MNKKRIAILIITLPIIIFLIWYGIQDQLPASTNSPTPTITATTSKTPIPTMPNFEKIVEPTSTNNTYQIDYYAPDESYFISILATPYEKYRLEAEQALVKKYNLTQSQACSIRITISMPYFVQNEVQPTYSTFSFCPRPPITP